MVNTRKRRSKVDDSAQRFALFGIRLEMNFASNVMVPNTKDKKIKYLMTQNVYLSKDVKANVVNDKMRQLLTNHANNATIQTYQTLSSIKKLTIPALFRKVHGTSKVIRRSGSVVGYFPASRKHAVLFDDEQQHTVEFDLLKEKKHWVRIPWPNNKLDDSEVGESQINPPSLSYITYGPECPRCFVSLGIGHQAWTFCSMCHLNEPGVMWSTRFSSMRTEKSYADDVEK